MSTTHPHRIALAGTALLLGCTSAPASLEPERMQCTPGSKAQVIPDAFLGTWNEEPARCGTGIGHGGLTLEPARVRYYESGGPVRAVVVDGVREIAIVAAMSGEGLEWLGLLHVRLSADASRLVELSAPGAPVVRHRCPPVAPAPRHALNADGAGGS